MMCQNYLICLTKTKKEKKILIRGEYFEATSGKNIDESGCLYKCFNWRLDK